MSEAVNPVYLQPGTRIGFYKIVTLVGRGGFGALYKVLRDGEPFALKLATFNTEELTEEERQGHEERADREVVALKSLRHPNIVHVHAFERWPDMRKGYPYIIMDFVEGHRLYDWRTKTRPSLRRIAEVFAKIGLALNEMHRLEVFHRDLKSENVLVRFDGEPIIVDFGISRPKSTFTVTRADVMLGTYTHFPPEYCRHFGSEGFRRGERFVYLPTADLHAVGYMLYHCLTGRPPFSTGHDNTIELLIEIESVVPPLPSTINPLVPPSMEAIVMRLLEKNPADRFQSGAELADALQKAIEQGDEAWLSPLDVPPRPAKTDGGEGAKSAEPVELGSQDLLSMTAARGDVAPIDEVEQFAVPSFELPISEASNAKAPPGEAPQGFSAPTAQARGFVAPDAEPKAAAPISEPPALGIPSVIRREGAKIEAARKAAERSRYRTPLLIGGGIAAFFCIVFVLSLSARPSNEIARTPSSALLDSAANAEGRLLPMAEPAPGAQLSHPQPPENGSSTATKRGTRRNADEEKIDELLAKSYGRPVLPAKGGKTGQSSGPSWLMRAARQTPAAEPSPAGAKKYGVPMGAKIRARLLSNLDSRTTGDGPIEAMLVRPYVQRGEVVFPSRTMMYGRASVSSGRFVVALTRMRLPDDTEVAFDGLAMNPEDSKPGLPAGRRIAGAAPSSESLSAKVAKNTANSLLGRAAGNDATQLASAAGQTVLNHQQSDPASLIQDTLLLDRGGDFDVFVKESF